MSAKITHNITVAVGTYTKDGVEKTNWETVGNRWVKDDGGVFFTMKKTFNPAGVPTKEGFKDIILNMMEQKEKPKSNESI